MSKERFIITSDNDCHWYVIPKNKNDEFDNWLDSEDAELGIIPDYAQEIGGSISRVSFENPIIS